MELGQKLRQARQEAGLSQRQLCGEEITRNMLSQIENGSARPSMDTLRYLAQRLGKPMSFFLDENIVVSPNQAIMAQVRTLYREKNYSQALTRLTEYRADDSVFDWERYLLEALCCMALAEQAIADGKLPYAEALLEQAQQAETPYFTPALERQRLLLLAECSGRSLSLPPDDRVMLLRARNAQYLDAAEDQTTPAWNLLRGQACMALEEFAAALPRLKSAEEPYPKEAIPLLEQCCRELEDYKGAYFYACKLRDLGR